MNKYIDIFKTVILAALLAVSVGSCTDDIDSPHGSAPEGENATVTLKINVTDAVKLSRATSDSYVRSLWVGIYNANSGKCTFSKTFAENKDAAEPVMQTLNLEECKSGSSYVVAVANYDGVTGFSMTDKVETPLETLLAEADTWEKYRAIAISQNMAGGGVDISVAEPADELIMSGHYSESHPTSIASDEEIVPVNILPGKNTFSGAVHLRRLWAQNTLNISKAGDVIDMELLDVEIINVPKHTWIQGRQQLDNIGSELDYANAGDAYDPQGSALDNPNYLTSMRFTPPAEIILKDGVYTFSFWQFENKRTGTSTAYEDREREHKNNGMNTGLYTALCPTSDGHLDNNATYVRIHANITYKSPSSDTNDGVDIPENPVSRTAEVTYNVHLGYIGKDATDFNCYRNSKYTYNITATGVHNVLVEAFTNTEKQPGAEGTVTDVTDKIENLDAHFGVFNIYLTEQEIRNFTFSVRAYQSGVAHTIYHDDKGNSNVPSPNDDNFKYYDWIEFVPTGNTSESTTYSTRLAAYPDITDGVRTGKVYYMDELSTSGLKGQWLTVYVNEYTYEARYGNAKWGNETNDTWKSYVNQPNRQAWFNVAQETSADGQSVYFKSKYALSQRSIQTYYNVDDTDCKAALGVEHNNESFGMNIRWLDAPKDGNADNGRYNVWNGINSDTKWSTYLQSNSLQSVNAITNTTQADLAGIDKSARTYSVKMQKLITSSSLLGSVGKYNGPAGNRDPQTSPNNAQYIEALYACLNRNRDENGNGQIDLAELKWYLPASGKYLRMILGRNSLSTPLMAYQQSVLPAGCKDDDNTLYHFVTSGGKIVWADEGLSSSVFTSGNDWSHAPWQLRCIRNLGTDLTITPTEKEVEQVTAAYDDSDFDKSTYGGVVKVKFYYGTDLREPTTSPLPMHKTSDPENKLGRYGFEIAPRGNKLVADAVEASAQIVDASSHTVISSAITIGNEDSYNRYKSTVDDAIHCATLNESTNRKGWRTPNQKEIVIMMRMGVLGSKATNYRYDWWSNDWTLKADEVDTAHGFMTCTQEHWNNNGSSSVALNSSYRIVSVDVTNKIGIAVNNAVRAIRCVRDLTAAEANKSYSDIVNNK